MFAIDDPLISKDSLAEGQGEEIKKLIHGRICVFGLCISFVRNSTNYLL